MSRSATKRLQQLNNDRARPSSSGPPSFRPPSEADQVVSRFSFILGTILIFLILAAGAAVLGTVGIQNDLKEQSERALRVAGFFDVAVSVDGFDVTLQGYYHESQSGDDAVAAVAAVNGVRNVEGGDLYVVEVADVDPEIVEGRPLTFSWSGGVLSVEGDVSSEGIYSYVATEPSSFVDADGAALFRNVDVGGLAVVEDITPVEGLADEADWVGNTMALLRTLATGLDEGSLVINPGGKVAITSGEVETRQEKRDITDALEDPQLALEADGFSIIPGIILPPDPFVATAEQVEELTHTLTELIGDKVVEFELNSAELTAEGEALLDDILVSLRELPNVPVEIAGHADASGTAEHNQELSEQRAQAVLDYFVAKGEDPVRFIVVGYGDTRPIPGATPEQNRRIEFIPLEG
jgi:outer membrane protein OmpA-like peptidoglycan-associated protein